MSLENRVASLERENRILRVVFLVAAVAAGVCVYWGRPTAIAQEKVAPPLPVIRAKRFELIGDGGKVLCSLNSDNGSGQVLVNDAKTARMIGMGFIDNKPVLGLEDENGTVELTSTDITVNAMNEEKRLINAIKLYRNPLKGGSIDVCNPLGNVVASVQSSKTNTGLIAVFDVNGVAARTFSKD